MVSRNPCSHSVTDTLSRYVRVLRHRPDGFVEFLFSVGDPELGVELILPAAAFDQFCAENRAQFVSPAEAEVIDINAWKWRFGQPGITE